MAPDTTKSGFHPALAVRPPFSPFLLSVLTTTSMAPALGDPLHEPREIQPCASSYCSTEKWLEGSVYRGREGALGNTRCHGFTMDLSAFPHVLFMVLLELFLHSRSLVAVVFGVGRGSAGRGSAAPIGSHLSHQQGSQQPVGNLGPGFNFPLESPNSQPSAGGPLSQPGFVSNGPNQSFRDGFSVGGMSQDFLGDDFKSQGSHVPYNIAEFSTQASQNGYSIDYASQGPQSGFPGSYLNQNSQAGFSRFGTGNDFMSQEYMSHGSQGLFTQVGFTDPSQQDSSLGHFGMGNANHLQSQAVMNPLYSQPYAHYNPPSPNLPQQNQQTQQQPNHQGQSSPNPKVHYSG